jgi:hypothetical protein
MRDNKSCPHDVFIGALLKNLMIKQIQLLENLGVRNLVVTFSGVLGIFKSSISAIYTR